jgi:4,5-DOPA dioxygenase extradiol
MDLRMPAVFIGHGSPLNALEDNEFTRRWRVTARAMPKPRAILCVSAHWLTRQPTVTTNLRPETIHDFFGFPRPLFDLKYPARGDVSLPKEVAALARGTTVAFDAQRGLDHGAWSVLKAMFPEGDVPVVQLSLASGKTPAFHYAMAQDLAALRDKGVLILGSGNVVHNLSVGDMEGTREWAVRFNDVVKQKLLAGEDAALVNYLALDPYSSKSVPSSEHYLPLLYVLAGAAGAPRSSTTRS